MALTSSCESSILEVQAIGQSGQRVVACLIIKLLIARCGRQRNPESVAKVASMCHLIAGEHRAPAIPEDNDAGKLVLPDNGQYEERCRSKRGQRRQIAFSHLTILDPEEIRSCS